MAKVKFVPDNAGIRDFLNSSAVQNELLRQAEAVRGRAGEDYIVDIRTGKTRAHARVATTSDKETRRSYRNNTLLKALGG